MSERDDELRQVLQRWEAPKAGASLDTKVWSAYRQSKRVKSWKWLPIAAGLLLAAGLASYWPGRSEASIQTRMDATGFRPIPNGAISVVKTGERQ